MIKKYILLIIVIGITSCAQEIGHNFVLQNDSAADIAGIELTGDFNYSFDSEGNIAKIDQLASGEKSTNYYWKAGTNAAFGSLPGQANFKLSFITQGNQTHTFFFSGQTLDMSATSEILFLNDRVKITNSIFNETFTVQ